METALKALSEILASGSNRRSRRLLRPPEAASPAWAMWVPTCFNAAVDIHQTETKKHGLEWTQGAGFGFKSGDTLYDTPKAYLPYDKKTDKFKWEDCLPHIAHCLVVCAATPAGTIGEGRFSGRVEFEHMTPEPGASALKSRGKFSTTQDDFLHLLISGKSEALSLK